MTYTRFALLLVFFYTFKIAAVTIDQFYLGTHLTHATSREDHGFVYRNEHGEKEDPYRTFARIGGNFVMMDHFVSCGYYGLDDIVGQAMRAEKAGLMVGINFHYSQHYSPDTIPHGWPQTYGKLKSKIYRYTDSVLTILADSGVTVDIVKVGNEIDWAYDENGNEGKTGFLFPIGSYDEKKSQFMGLLREACRAVKDVDNSIPIAIHLMNHNARSSAKLFKEIADSGISFDICAKSWYSHWGDYLSEATEHFTAIINETGKYVMITECAFPWTKNDFGPPQNKGQSKEEQNYPFSKTGARQYYLELIRQIAALPGSKGIGVVTWPGAYTYNAAAPKVPDGCGQAFMKDPNSTNTSSLGRSTWDNACFWHSETGEIISEVVSAFDTCVISGEGMAPCTSASVKDVHFQFASHGNSFSVGLKKAINISNSRFTKRPGVYIVHIPKRGSKIRYYDIKGRDITQSVIYPSRHIH